MVDIAKIKEKLANLKRENERRPKNNWKWKPDDGKYEVRLLPWPDDPEDPIKSLQFYFGIKRYGLLAPAQFGKPDPIAEFQKKLYERGTDEDKGVAKKLYPKPRGFVPIVVRGQEDKGVLIWEFSPTIHQRIYELFCDEDYGVLNDPEKGHDLKVNFYKKPEKKFRDTDVDPRVKQTSLSKNESQAKEWLDSIPSLSDKFELHSYEELKKFVSDWFDGKVDDGNDGIARGGSAEKSSNSKESKGGDVPNSFDDLDDAFDDVMDPAKK